DPDPGLEPELADLLDEPGESVGELALVDLIVAQSGRVVLASGEPAVVDHEQLQAQVSGAPGLLEQASLADVEGDRLPAVVDHGSWGVAPALGHDVPVHEGVHPLGETIESAVGEAEHRLGGLELLPRRQRPGEGLLVDAAGDANQSAAAAL